MDDKGVLISGRCFDLSNTFNNGQCFRWDKLDDNIYGGVAFGRFLKVIQEPCGVRLYCSQEDYDGIWKSYFDLETDYQSIEDSLKADSIMNKAIEAGHGMHILRQDLWEVLISFIISQNNNIARIKKIIGNMCKLYGQKIEIDTQETGIKADDLQEKIFTFPTPNELARADIKGLESCGAGYRADYILTVARNVQEGLLDLKDLQMGTYDYARELLIKQKGIGPKVADCILLFGLHHLQAFPVDTWIKKAMCSLYMTPEAKSSEIIKYATDYFGKYAGMAQQYMFYAAREGRLVI